MLSDLSTFTCKCFPNRYGLRKSLLSPNFSMNGSFPEIQGGGSLILAWQVRNKKVLVVGGGEVNQPCDDRSLHGIVDIDKQSR